MRNGTTVFAGSLYQHPEIFGMLNLVERLGFAKLGVPQNHLWKIYPTMLKEIARNGLPKGENEKITTLYTNRNVKVVVERTHQMPRNTEMEIGENPDIKILAIIRDFKEVVLSYIKWYSFPLRKQHVPLQEFVRRLTKHLINGVKRYERMSRANKTLLVKHEDICENPRHWGKKVFEWLNISTNQSNIEAFAGNYKPAVVRRLNNNDYQEYWSPELEGLYQKYFS